MRDQYDINKNYKAPSDDAINSKMDFDAVLRAAQEQRAEGDRVKTISSKRQVWKRVSAIAAAVALLIALGLGFLKEDYHTKQEKYFTSKPFVNPPAVEAAKPVFASYRVPAYEGGIIEHETGSKITIPKEAFEYNNGDIVTGEVDILYREMHDFIDFFLSGIPMTYDSLGTTYNLESAGMVEIFAEQGGQRVNMRPGKSLEVELVSVVEVPNLSIPPSFNIYKLNEGERRWEYRNIDNIQFMESAPEKLPIGHQAYEVQKEYFDRILELEMLQQDLLSKVSESLPIPKEPVRPTQKRNEALTLNIDLGQQLKEAAPNLYDKYKDAFWQAHPSEKVSMSELDKNWEETKLVQFNELDFELTFIKGEERKTILVNPLLTGRKFERAMQKYRRDKDQYAQKMETWEDNLAIRQKEIKAKTAEQKKAAQMQYVTNLENLKKQGKDVDVQSLASRTKVINKFKADELGIWNCDRPVLPDLKAFNARFKLPNGKVLNKVTAYMAAKGSNSIEKFLLARKTPLHVDLTKEYLIWVVLPDNKIALLQPKDLKDLDLSKNKQSFTMTMVEDTAIPENQLRKVLSF